MHKKGFFVILQIIIASAVALTSVQAQTIPLIIINNHSGIADAVYLFEYPVATDGLWSEHLLEVNGSGNIRVVRSTTANRDRKFAPRLLDFRSVNGHRYFFTSYPPFENGHVVPYREFCELDEKDKPINCYQHDHLDAHDWLPALDGDRIFMFYEPRLSWQGVFFEARPLDVVLRQITPTGRVVWEWSSAGKLNIDDKITSNLRQKIGKISSADKNLSWVFQRISSKLEDFFKFVLAKLGLLDAPLCIRYFGGCFIENANDYVHANSLEWDDDGGIIISSRAQSKVFKIDYRSGKVLWTFGGYGARHTDFKILNDPLGGFSYQHSARKLKNGNILLYDNGNLRPDGHSRAVEYHLDMTKMTATLVWEYRAEPTYQHRDCCGAVQSLPDGNRLITWGGWDKDFNPSIGTLPIATLVTSAGKVVFEIRSPTFEHPYRVWHPYSMAIPIH